VKWKYPPEVKPRLNQKVDIYYFNNFSYPKSATASKKNGVFLKVFGAAFFKKGQYCVAN